MNGVLAPFQDPELAFIPAAASLFTGRNRVYVRMYVYAWVALWGPIAGWKGPRVLPYRALNYARERAFYYRGNRRLNPSHPDPPERTFGLRGWKTREEKNERERDISPWRIRNDPLDVGWRKDGLFAMIDAFSRRKSHGARDAVTRRRVETRRKTSLLHLFSIEVENSTGEKALE